MQEFCDKPDINRFNLKFDTLMTVKCYDDPNLHEWYSVSGEYDDVVLQNVGYDDSNDGVIIDTRAHIYERRYDVSGAVLKVASISIPEDHRTDDIDTFAMVFQTMAEHMNFTIINVTGETLYGSYDNNTKTWSGLLGRLQSGEADIVISDISMTQERIQAFDFAGPLVLSRDRLYIREPASSLLQWDAYLKAFDYSIWLLIIAVIVVSAFLLTCMGTTMYKVRSLKNYLVENHLYVWGIYCQQGLPELPKSSPLRIVYVTIFFSAIIVSAIYSASIISHLTLFSPILPFTTLPEFVRHGTTKLIVIRDSAEFDMFRNSKDEILSKMNKVMKKKEELPTNDVEAFDQVCRQNVAFYTNSAVSRLLNGPIKCKIVAIPTGRIDNLAFAISKYNPFTDLIHYNILKFKVFGIMRRIKTLSLVKKDAPAKHFNSVELLGITPLLVVLIFGVLSSVFILIIEKLCHSVTQFNK